MEEEFKTKTERLRKRFDGWKEPTAEEYEAETAPLREALRKAVGYRKRCLRRNERLAVQGN